MQRDPITIAPETPLLQVLHLFVVAQISGAPVVDRHQAVLGVITDVDLLRAFDQACDEDLDEEVPVAASGNDSRQIPERLEGVTAKDIATPHAVWTSPDTPVEAVARLLRAEGIHRVLVGRDGKLAGILTAFDLLEAVR